MFLPSIPNQSVQSHNDTDLIHMEINWLIDIIISKIKNSNAPDNTVMANKHCSDPQYP